MCFVELVHVGDCRESTGVHARMWRPRRSLLESGNTTRAAHRRPLHMQRIKLSRQQFGSSDFVGILSSECLKQLAQLPDTCPNNPIPAAAAF